MLSCSSSSVLPHDTLPDCLEKHVLSDFEGCKDERTPSSRVDAFTAEELGEFAAFLQNDTADKNAAVTCMWKLRNDAIKKGRVARQQATLCKPIYDFVLASCLDSSMSLQEVGCRTLFALISSNKSAGDRLAGDVRLMNTLFELAVQPTAQAGLSSPTGVKRVKYEESGCSGAIRASCAAFWAISALASRRRMLQRLCSAREDLLEAAVYLMGLPFEDAQSSACWFLHNIMTGNSEVTRIVGSTSLATCLVNLLEFGCLGSMSVIIWTLRTYLDDNRQHKAQLMELGAFCKMDDLFARTQTTFHTKAAIVWTIGAFVRGDTEFQNYIRVCQDGRIFRRVVSCLELDAHAQVQSQAAATAYELMGRNTQNQTLFADCGGIERLVALLFKHDVSLEFAEKVIAGLLSASLKHTSNQRRIVDVPGSVSRIIRFLACSSPRVQGLAGGLIRVFSTQPDIQLMFAAHGALAHLLDNVTSKDEFAQEQALAAMHCISIGHPTSKTMLLALEVHNNLCDVILDCTKPSNLSYGCALNILHYLCQDNPDLIMNLASRSSFVSGLLRLSHPSCTCAHTRAQADRLLRVISPEVIENRAGPTCLSVLDALIPCPPRPGVCIDCPICMFEDDKEPTIFLPCFHSFHTSCLTSWLSSGRDSCPICKLSVLHSLGKSHC